MPVGSPYGIARRSPDRLGWKYRTVGKVSHTVVSKVEISNLKPVRDDMQEARTVLVLQNIVDITWGGVRLEMVRLWSLVRAQARQEGVGWRQMASNPLPL